MSVLKRLKRGTLSAAKRRGLFERSAASRWRSERLLILGYHGVSIRDEHEWDGTLFLSPERFEERLYLLREGGYAVLRLGDALEQLANRTLPPRSIVLTFDDGTLDFKLRVQPMLEKFGFPATVYLTTYYCDAGMPVWTVFWSYLLWKGRDQVLEARCLTGRKDRWNLALASERARASAALAQFANQTNLSSAGRDDLGRALAQALGLDHAALTSAGILRILSPDDVSALAVRGVDFQLHTHRHRSPSDHELFAREILENRERIERLTGRSATHFCYPSGIYRPELLPWLREAGVVSAATCDPGLATAGSESLLLPRIVDTSSFNGVEFEAWLSGMAAVLPRRPPRRATQQTPCDSPVVN